jgi:hypothetical protein
MRIAVSLRVSGPAERLIFPSGGEASWKEKPAGKGSRRPATDATNEGKGYATAWLIPTAVDRFQAFDVEVLGQSPEAVVRRRRAGRPGGLKKDGAGSEAKGSIKLEQGTHALLSRRSTNPSAVRPGARASRSSRRSPTRRTRPCSPTASILSGISRWPMFSTHRWTSVRSPPDGSVVAAGLAGGAGSDDVETWVEIRRVADGSLVRTMRGESPSQLRGRPPARRCPTARATGAKEGRIRVRSGSRSSNPETSPRSSSASRIFPATSGH